MLLIHRIVLIFLCIFFINATGGSHRMNRTNPSDTPHNTGSPYSFDCMHSTHSPHSINNSRTHFLLIVWKFD